jgi:hypothetical protein
MMLKITETDPDFDSLRDDPRFNTIIARERKRHGLAEPVAADRPTMTVPPATPATS